MNKKIIVIPIVIVLGIIIIGIIFDSKKTVDDAISVPFHVTLADPELYVEGVYTDRFTISEGNYSFRFVPNGSSPEILSILLKGVNFEFEEDFMLENILHQTEISEYYTWKYNGPGNFSISKIQEITIIINPNGNVKGSVSVFIVEN